MTDARAWWQVSSRTYQSAIQASCRYLHSGQSLPSSPDPAWSLLRVATCTPVSAAEWLELHTQVQRTSERLRRAFAPDHFNYAFLQNQDRHVHLHVIPPMRHPAKARASSSTTPIARITTPSQVADAASRRRSSMRWQSCSRARSRTRDGSPQHQVHRGAPGSAGQKCHIGRRGPSLSPGASRLPLRPALRREIHDPESSWPRGLGSGFSTTISP
jgi:hypothetical protein